VIVTSSRGGRPARVALVTCAELPELDPDDRLLLSPLAELGVGADAVVWDDAGVNWGTYDLVVLRSTWDYPRRRDEFVAWARTVPRLVNPADVVAWNTDKRYLGELAVTGLPVVPTEWIAPADTWALPARGDWVIKPAVSAGSRDTGRYDIGDRSHRELATAHVARLLAADRLVMVQPYLPAVDTYGETSLLFVGGEYSHAIRKGPMLAGPDVGVAGLYRAEDIEARQPTEVELQVGARAMAAVPGGAGRLLYARVDLIPGRGGDPLVVELELTEPSLFLGTAAHAPALLARAIATAAHDA
jgi:glutathione synthase/RimK-type ligase-like ATP-grasp enzyme